jgi:sporulation protein YunB
MLNIKRLSSKTKPKVLKAIIVVVIIVAIFIFCTVYFRSNVVPIVIEGSVAKVRAITTNAVNLAATTVLKGGISYDDLFNVIYDSDNKISMIQANSPSINSIAREIANLAQANLDQLGTQEVSIALGTFTGLALLTGFGPEIIIKILPIGTANCDFVSQFISAGINQTLHKIYIDVYADVEIITPFDEPLIRVKAEVLVCENVIVGEIPEIYLNSSGNGSLFELNP